NTKFFVAARQNTEYARVPTTEPDMERQVMMNVVYQGDIRNKFKFSYIVDNTTENVFDSNYLRWLFDRTLSVSKYDRLSMQYAMEWNHQFSNSTIMDLKVNLLDIKTEETIDLLAAGEFIEDYRDGTNWTDYNKGPSGHFLGKPKDDIGNDKTRTYTFDGSVSSQLNKGNLVKAGIQFSYYDVDIERNLNVSDQAAYRLVKFAINPYEGAFYIQDKMEFEGMISNIGLRLDFNDLQSKYYSDPYAAARFQTPDKDVGLFFKLQPRIGFSFPVSEKAFFHLNYGTFTQRPTFSQLFFNQADANGNVEVLGNPNLKPENTQSYDIGLVQAFPYGFRLDVSAYYKDVKNLVETAFYKNAEQATYATYVNRDYADIKGFHVSLEKTDGPI
ncbi:MAG: TonB-dependent receptor, partial [Candidatus Heimdallarchaeota archaeon]|nr:TonB-dependent receptor [Candidatus Heimdallarchaeota archaeon]